MILALFTSKIINPTKLFWHRLLQRHPEEQMAGEPTSSPFNPVSLKVSNKGESNASPRQRPPSLLRQPVQGPYRK